MTNSRITLENLNLFENRAPFMLLTAMTFMCVHMWCVAERKRR